MKYPYRVFQWKNGDDVYWVAESTILRGCAAQGDTIEAACEGLRLSEESWLESAPEFGIPIPNIIPEETNSYSGKFTVRISPNIHRDAAEKAKILKISLAQYVSDSLAAYNVAMNCSDYIYNVLNPRIDKAMAEHEYKTACSQCQICLNADRFEKKSCSSVQDNLINVTYLSKEG